MSDFTREIAEKIRKEREERLIATEKTNGDRRLIDAHWPALQDEVKNRIKSEVEDINSRAGINAFSLDDKGSSLSLTYRKTVEVIFNRTLKQLSVTVNRFPTKFSVMVGENDLVSFCNETSPMSPEAVANYVIELATT